MIDLLSAIGKGPETRVKRIEIGKPFIDIAAGFASTEGTVLLMSGGDLDCSRYHILGIKPWLSFTGRGLKQNITICGRSLEFESDPFDALRVILDTYHTEEPSSQLPLTSGLMGYLAYDLKDHIENIPRTSVDDLGLPHICLFAPSVILIHDKKDGSTWLCDNRTHADDSDVISRLKTACAETRTDLPGKRGAHGFKSNMTREEYISSIERIREHIASGDVYQVNFAQRFESEFSDDPFELFKTWYLENPAPFFAYINAGSHYILSTSPERFICRDKAEVETRPIKGTRPRGKDISEDRALKDELEKSEKDDAELSMIVDLMRNDLGKVCECGSVHVAQHRRVEEYGNVFHTVSIVRGRLDRRYDSIDLIRATFPGGSITGCPRIRAMEIIDRLEPNRRHVYTGSIGYLGFNDTMDLSIAIRTALIFNDKMFVSVGGGIVYDSKPQEEYDETLHKGRTIMKISHERDESVNEETAWINGMLRPAGAAHIKISDLGLQYGYGFFETVRFSRGAPRFLAEHIKRFNRAWRELFQDECPDLSWHDIIDQVIDANMLKDKVASVKIMASWGSRLEPPFDHNIIVTARRYVSRLEGKNAGGLGLAVYPHPRQSPLADYKTLNYAYYYLAGKWAMSHGADEALILNPDGSISETNTASIMLIKGETIVRPLSPHCLPGIMEEKVSDIFISWGYKIEQRPVKVEELFASDAVIITNSLIGAVPVTDIDKKALKMRPDICKSINEIIL
ncbi:MAG: aminodeoxychorismate synthase component I [Deltaproteobacteria bacterium]|nr:aminodeoxychorismate synthase component I [Deltaproteobacteria bacterium]